MSGGSNTTLPKVPDTKSFSPLKDIQTAEIKVRGHKNLIFNNQNYSNIPLSQRSSMKNVTSEKPFNAYENLNIPK